MSSWQQGAGKSKSGPNRRSRSHRRSRQSLHSPQPIAKIFKGPIQLHFSGPRRRATRSNGPHQPTIMPATSRMLHGKQRLAARGRLQAAAQPRILRAGRPIRGGGGACRGRRAAGAAQFGAGEQFGELSSLPALSCTSRSSRQPIAARCSGWLAPWQDQPDSRRRGCSKLLTKPRQDAAGAARSVSVSSVTAPNLLSITPAVWISRVPSGSIRAARSASGGRPWLDLGAGPVDFKFGRHRLVRRGPAQHVLAAAFAVPQHLISLCLAGEIELAHGEGRGRARGRHEIRAAAPARPRRPRTASYNVSPA